MKTEKFPKCPICGAETDTFYYNKHLGEIVGCDNCLDSRDAWEDLAEELTYRN